MNQAISSNKPLLISFSGIDGAGKSTQISRVCELLDLSGARVRLITFWDDVVALKSFREDVGHKVFKGDQGVGSPEAPISRRDKNVQSPLLTLSRMFLYALDALSLRRTIKKVLAKGTATKPDVIIFDRFLYDELANLNLSSALGRFYAKVLLRLIPKPDLAFVLDADPVAAFARKPEYPLEFLHSNRKAYMDMAKLAGMIIVPPSTINGTHAVLRAHMQNRIALTPRGEESGQVFGQKQLAT